MKSPVVLKTIAEMIQWRRSVVDQSVGFVPTMGALHEGHASLLKKSGDENDITVLSIFVNPTQFNQTQDLAKYPRTWDEDIRCATAEGVDAVFYPSFTDMYPDNYIFSVHENDFSHLLCGASRPGHFQGVLTIVLKLINLVQPQKVYMGEKDYQQLHLIKKMVQALFLPTQIIGCPTIRNADGLALSSRNTRLSDDERDRSSLIYKTITTAANTTEAKTILEKAGFKIDYLVDIENRRYAAVYVGDVRLIDNVPL
ncbi:MAG: pantoate--beta-alanine ligase [Bdellovibrionaceae bacterium]|nr:pantoate--beta-alanine ligase [Pseudobdellovibrionaceae bacterium]